jgi:HK97 family phage prohead protease
MPYYISDGNPDCSGWAVEKDDGELVGCHSTKQDAIDQMVAVSIAEGMEPGGERALPAPSPEDEDRNVDLTVPGYIRDAAEQGLRFHEEGLSGGGLRPSTVREARLMARGQVSEDKVIRANAWGARHEVDLDADGAKPGEDGYPTAGAVAHLLWGIPTGARYSDARGWFARKAEQIRNEENRMDATPVKPRTKGSGVEFRSAVGELRMDGEGNTFVGYAAVFNSPSQPLPFTERIAPGAFGRSIRRRNKDIRLYVNHNSDMVLASRRSGTLRLDEDDRGLRVEADLPDTSYARDLRALLSSGVVDKMSFGFTVPRGGDSWSDDGSERVLREIALHEVSVVTGFPAYEKTAATVRALDGLASRSGIGVDELSEALDALAEGETLDADMAERLMAAIAAATPAAPAPAGPPPSLMAKAAKLQLLKGL